MATSFPPARVWSARIAYSFMPRFFSNRVQSAQHGFPAVIVMAYPAENVLELPPSQRNEEIQTLPADRSD